MLWWSVIAEACVVRVCRGQAGVGRGGDAAGSWDGGDGLVFRVMARAPSSALEAWMPAARRVRREMCRPVAWRRAAAAWAWVSRSGWMIAVVRSWLGLVLGLVRGGPRLWSGGVGVGVQEVGEGGAHA